MVYRIIIRMTNMHTRTSVMGIANQIASAPAMTGSRKIRIPLITRPLETEMAKAIWGFMSAWK